MISIAAVGDILMWPRQIEAARTGDGYSFDYVFDDVRKHLKADLVIGNLETTFSGSQPFIEWNQQGNWRQPSFSCPDELAPALKRAGFHVLVTANNHIMDRGMGGMLRTIDVLDKHGIEHVGCYRTEWHSKPLITQVQGRYVGIVAGTYGTNLGKLPDRPRWAVTLLPDVVEILARTRPHVDVLIAYLHVGNEFVDEPSEATGCWFDRCFKAGADIVLGSHPHVLQPVETVNGKVAAYSLGNFVSKKMNGDPQTMRSGILRIEAGKAEIIPTWTGQKRFVIRTRKDSTVHPSPLSTLTAECQATPLSTLDTQRTKPARARAARR